MRSSSGPITVNIGKTDPILRTAQREHQRFGLFRVAAIGHFARHRRFGVFGILLRIGRLIPKPHQIDHQHRALSGQIGNGAELLFCGVESRA
jgi:hypothetical protein